MSFSKPLEC